MEYLADTVAIIRHFSKAGKIGSKAKEIFKQADTGNNIIWISIISLAEVMYLAERHRIPINLDEFTGILEGLDNYRIVDLNIEIIMVANTIHEFELHDRLIVASAKYLNIPIITSDAEIQSSNVIAVDWD